MSIFDWLEKAKTRRPLGAELAQSSGIISSGLDCQTCLLQMLRCSPVLAPGETWTVETQDTSFSPSAHLSLQAYSLSTRDVVEAGADWQAWLSDRGLALEGSLADAVCAELPKLMGTVEEQAEGDPETPDCHRQRDFLRDYQAGGPSALFGDADIEPLRGEPIGGSVSLPAPTDELQRNMEGPWVVERYAALPLSEIGSAGDAAQGPYRYTLPGIYQSTLEGRFGNLLLANPGTECATVTLQAHRAGGLLPPSRLGDAPGFRLVPGETLEFPIDALWPAGQQGGGAVTLRLESSQPIAALALNYGYHVVSAHSALRDRQHPGSWALPRAYQEPAPIVSSALSGMLQNAGQGRETNVYVFSAGSEREYIRLQTHSRSGERNASYPVSPLQQLVFQLGFGLGRQGGPGWARIHSPEAPIYVAGESLRMFEDVPAPSAVWAAPAQRILDAEHPPQRAIALPDLGGPAVGAGGFQLALTRTATMTEGLRSRIVVQNVLSRTARVALYQRVSGCIPSNQQFEIPPSRALTLVMEDLDGTRWGADSALLRVLDGEVAALVETTREEQTSLETAEPDWSTAYLGSPSFEPVWEPPILPAFLGLTPERYRLEGPQPVTLDVWPHRTGFVGGHPRCLSYRAEVDVPWLSIERGVLGPLPNEDEIDPSAPGPIGLRIDPSNLEPGLTHTGRLIVHGAESDIEQSPRELVIEVRLPGGSTGGIYLPSLLLRSGDER